MPSFEVEIKSMTCKGCAICVEVCPEACLAMSDNFNKSGHYYPEPVAIEKCTGCGACANLCPDFAVTVYKIKEAV